MDSVQQIYVRNLGNLMIIFALGAKGDWDFRISDLVKTLMEMIFNPCGEIR